MYIRVILLLQNTRSHVQILPHEWLLVQCAGYQSLCHGLPESPIFTFIQAGEAAVQASYLTVGDWREDSKDVIR